MEIDMVDNATLGTIIKVVGVGGAGGNAVQHMINKGVSGVEFIAANTDAQALKTSLADNVIQIGETGLGAGMQPDVGRKLAEETRGRIEDALRGAHMVFIAAGMGGGTGTGAAPVVAQVAKEQGALTVAVVSKPFSYEGQKCMDLAEEGLEELSQYVDSLIVILNEKLEEIYEDDSMIEWLGHADDVLNNAVAGIAEIINVPGHINVDFNDVKTIMSEQGKAMMGTATASGVDRARIAAEQAVASPLLDGIDLSGAKGVLVNVTASRNLKGKEIKEVMATVRAFAAADASIAQGIAYDDAMGDEIRVTVVATGLGRTRKSVQLVQAPVLRTGTSNEPVMGEVQTTNAGFGGLKAPAVWRRESASDTVRALEKNGVETYDIPAFLRKQAD
jgi:cell division protein FtsZ